MEFDELSNRVIGCALNVHKELGPGLLESAYEQCLGYELEAFGIRFERQKELPIRYKGNPIDCAYRIDLLVEEVVLVELKSVERLMPIHSAQLLTYMRLSGARVGLLLNFNVPVLRDGMRRMVL